MLHAKNSTGHRCDSNPGQLLAIHWTELVNLTACILFTDFLCAAIKVKDILRCVMEDSAWYEVKYPSSNLDWQLSLSISLFIYLYNIVSLSINNCIVMIVCWILNLFKGVLCSNLSFIFDCFQFISKVGDIFSQHHYVFYKLKRESVTEYTFYIISMVSVFTVLNYLI